MLTFGSFCHLRLVSAQLQRLPRLERLHNQIRTRRLSTIGVQTRSHLATPSCPLSALLTITHAAKAPPPSLTHTHTLARLAQNALANLVLITPQKAFLQKGVGSQRGCGERRRGLNLDDLIDWRRRKKKKKVWTKDKRGNLRTGLKEAWGGEGVSDLRVAKREEEEPRDFKKKKSGGGCITESSKLLWQRHGNSREFADGECCGADEVARRSQCTRSRDSPMWRPQPSAGSKLWCNRRRYLSARNNVQLR